MLAVEAEPKAAPPAGAGEDAVVAVRGLTKVFKDFWGRPKARAVDNVEFTVRRGEVFGLLGPNGSGKSTTVKLILGLLNATRGLIEVFGRSPHHVATKQRIGYLPEESYLYRYLDSGETLNFFGNLFHLRPEDRRNRSEQLLEMVGLSQVRRRTVGEFSKGMQRRIGLAQALINDPDLVILDEPTAGLDPIGCREVKDLILALARRGKTVILSSHLLADVEDVCDRVVIYYGGRIQAMGPLKDLLATPDRVRITAPVLPRATLERVLGILRTEAGNDAVRLDNPTQNLESYFLGVVEKAKQTEATSGATSGARVASYLRGDGESLAAPADRLLERLTATAAPEAPAPGVSVPDAVVDETRLAALTDQVTAAGPTPRPPVARAQAPAEDLAKANEKLADLLGGKS
jgi:ABC-2 type transport system ATP-binding protein